MDFIVKIPTIYAIPEKEYKFQDLIPLNNESNMALQPKDLKISLKDHQKTSLNMIQHLEKNGGFYFVKRKNVSTLKEIDINSVDLSRENIYKYEPSYWVLSDKTGYGKTLTSVCILYNKLDTSKINYNFIYKYENISKPYVDINKKIYNDYESLFDTIIDDLKKDAIGIYNSYDKTYYKSKNLFSNIILNLKNSITTNKINVVTNTINFDLYTNKMLGQNLITFNNFSKYEETFNNVFNTTIIITPFGKVFKQWISTIESNTSLKGISILNSSKDLEKEMKFESTFKDSINDFIKKYTKLDYINNIEDKENFEYEIEILNNLLFNCNYSHNYTNVSSLIIKLLVLFDKPTILQDINNLKNIAINYKKNIDNLDYILIGNTFAYQLIHMLIGKYDKIINLINILYIKYYIDNFTISYMQTDKYKNFNSNVSIDSQKKNKLNHHLYNFPERVFDTDYLNKYKTKFYRILIDEADSIKLNGKYSIEIKDKYIKLGLITATYKKLLESRNNYISFIDTGSYHNCLSSIIPIISNDEEFLKKSFEMPTIFKKYYKCIMSNNLDNVNYLVNNNLISKNVLEMINVGDYESAVKEAGGNITQDDTIIDSITKELYKKIHNKKIERDMISKLDMTASVKTAKIETLNKDIKILEEKINDVNNKFKDIEIFDKIAKKYGEDLLVRLDEVNNEFYNGNDNIEFENKIKDLFKAFYVDSNDSQNNINKEHDLLANKLINILRSDDKNCGICSSFYRKPMVLECKHIFCSKCITTWIKSGLNKKFCPLCKKNIDLKKVQIITDSVESSNTKESKNDKNNIDIKKIKNPEELFAHYFKPLLTGNNGNSNNPNVNDSNLNTNDSVNTKSKVSKSKVSKSKDTSNDNKTINKYESNEEKPNTVLNLLNYLNMYKDKKIIIFSNYDSISEKINNAISNNHYNFKVEFPKGQGAEKSIDRFRNGSSNLLFLNSKHNGAGIEIPEGTDIIILHKMETALDTQIIGRCMRLGRSKPLDVHYILHENEMTDI